MAIPLTNMTVVGDMGDTVKAAYDLRAYMSLRPELVYSTVATVKPTRQSHRGSTVQFNFVPDLAANVTALTEAAEIAGKNLTDTAATVTLLEYGDAVQTSALLRGTDFLEVDTVASDIVGWHAGLSYDTLARNVLEDDSTIASAARKQFVGQTAETAITATDTLEATHPAKAVAQLRGDNARPIAQGAYAGFLHPDVSYDLRQEGAQFSFDEGTTRSPGTTSPGFGLFPYLAANSVTAGDRPWSGMIGRFAGIDFVETSTADINTDGGASTVDTYTTTIVGQEALAMAFAANVAGVVPNIVLGPIVDQLRRFATVGWYWLGGFGEFREESRHLIISASSIGAN